MRTVEGETTDGDAGKLPEDDREEEWRDGWLWVKDHPQGGWWPANRDDVIGSLGRRLAALEAKVNEKPV